MKTERPPLEDQLRIARRQCKRKNDKEGVVYYDNCLQNLKKGYVAFASWEQYKNNWAHTEELKRKNRNETQKACQKMDVKS